MSTFKCECGLDGKVERNGRYLCWWCYLGPKIYKLRFRDYEKMKKYQEDRKGQNE